MNIFDASSVIQETSLMTKDELLAEIIPKLEQILKVRFADNQNKQKIKIYKDRVSFAAPCCGDSAKDSTKKRGNIILEGKFKNLYKCHNCGTSMSMYNFFKKYGQTLSLRAIDYVITNKPDNSQINLDSSINLLYDTEIIDEFALDREEFKTKCHLEECNVPNSAYYYLVNRKQFDFTKFLYNPKHNLLFILNLTPSGKIVGVQVRNMNKFFTGPKYKTYKLSKIYEMFLHEPKEIPDEIENISMAFNILLVDYNKVITVVEGPMDSFLLKNCVALCGANHSLPFIMHFRYLFDNDKTGRKHAIEKLNEGNEVFMWDKLCKDFYLPQRDKWDVNDVVKYCYDNKIQFPKFDLYFSNDQLDLLDI